MFAHERAVKSIEQAQQESCTRYFWLINYLTDYTGFDFLWEPVPWQSHQRHAWASQWQKDAGTYLVPRTGYTETNYRTDQTLTRLPDITLWEIPNPVENFDYSWHPDPTDPPLTYYFGTQWQRTGGPVYQNGNDTVKIVDTPRAVAQPTQQHWTNVNGEFDCSWHPDLLDNAYIYQFGTQHQRTGGPQYCVPGATDVKYVDQIKIKTNRVATAIYEIDHMDGNAGQIPGTTKTSRYFDNYLDTLRRIAKGIPPEHEFVWICSSVCDYSKFDFSWHPEQWQATMLHVFASDGEKFGDTFFMHVPTFQSRADRCQLLDWYDLNFVGTSVPRRPLPVIEHNYDTHVEAIKTIDWPGPLAVFTTHNTPASVPCVPLWREKTKTVVPMSAGASSVIVPKVAVPYIKTQIYDYPYIEKKQRHLRNDQPLDIVFISNGEINADYHYEKLGFYVGDRNRIRHVNGINGRVAAYHAAANQSSTPWFFAVFAKLLVDEQFDWSWQPDRLQEPKHYIFHAKNPCNGLIYGHQAMIAYNKQLTLNNPGQGLDFTLDSAHEVVPIVSGTAYYNQTPWMTWRTAFREVLKLRDSLPDVENEYRINRWCTNGESKNSQWSSAGAQDALEYYNEVGGNFDDLKKSYEWAWLASYAFLKHGLIPD
ncbi:hypothetical protein UFOVP328_201 [uncultured Caudovirales phage]|uniref:Uncharacterized protein n=1 Tax=uncultured Caudovirales phage TaxID=2100421 RepID=A0A6J5LUB8_9CAUD|nr:hypothetical protein UFOVP328_201 [uncultured Caudovirales phage]